MKEENCKGCGLVTEVKDLVTEMVAFANGTLHKKASCPECGGYIKWLRHAPPKLYVGKYKDKEIEWIADNDPEYLKWFLNNDIKLGLRMTIMDILKEKGIVK